ncbi:MAG: DedA family protein [Acidimicrobiales bacterium]
MEQADRPRPSRLTLTLLVTPIIGIVLIGLAGQAFFPTLLKDHPLGLVALEPRARNLILVAGREGGIDFLPFLVIAVIRKLISDPLFYLLGLFYGDNAVAWVERKMNDQAGMVRGMERMFQKAGWAMVFLFPGGLVCALAGATGMNWVLFVTLNIVGTITMVTLYYLLAGVSWVEAPLESVTGFITGNSKWLTVLSLGFTVLWLINQRRQGKLDVQGVDEIERQLEGPTRGGTAEQEPDAGPT